MSKRVNLPNNLSLGSKPNSKPKLDTQDRLWEMAEYLSKGNGRLSTGEYFAEKWGLEPSTVISKYYYTALKMLQPTAMDEYKKGLIQQNIDRLELIIEDTMKTKGIAYTNAIAAIKELNKMLGLGDGKMVAVETPDTKFVIKFGDE